MKKHHIAIAAAVIALILLAWYWWAHRNTAASVSLPSGGFTATTSNALPSMPPLQWPDLSALFRGTNNNLFPIYGFVSSPNGAKIS